MPDATDNRVLSQLMLLQGTLESMPTDESISRFVSRGLKSVPGVISLNVCIRGAVAEKNDLCASCNYRWGEAEDNFDYLCKLKDYGNKKCFSIRTVDRLYGFVVFSLNDTPDAFTPYEPYLQNIANVIALSIDNKQQRQLLEAFNKQLQREAEHRKQKEESLKESEERFRELFDTVPSGVAIYEVLNDGLIGKDYIIRDFNRMSLQLEGRQKEDVIGKSLFDLRPTIDEYGLIPVFRNVWKTGVPSYYPQKIYIDEKFARYYENRVFRLPRGEIVAVYNDITESKHAEEIIKASLLEKETMLKEIHHRVKNNLQVISSLLDLQSSYLQDEKAREMLQNSMDRVRTMAMIHTQLYQSQDLARVDFGSFIRDLIGNISQSYGMAESPVEIHVDAGEINLGIDASIPCGLILNELVSNALKHAFPEGKEGEINIRMRLKDSRVALTVQDNGIGFPESIDLTNLKSLGLELVNILVGQMNGKMDMQVDCGTTWTITFPVKNEREWRDG